MASFFQNAFKISDKSRKSRINQGVEYQKIIRINPIRINEASDKSRDGYIWSIFGQLKYYSERFENNHETHNRVNS